MRRGYINFYAVYIGWLCSAVFLHLPSFQALGLDVRTDLSVLLTIFLLSLLVRPLRRALACSPRHLTERPPPCCIHVSLPCDARMRMQCAGQS